MDFRQDYESDYWRDLNAYIQNDYGTAALMGNLMAESGCIPYRKQGDNTPPYAASQTYTIEVDGGQVTRNDFINAGSGYGVAQWTWSKRKEDLYDLHVSNNLSIGSYELSLKMIFFEFEGSYSSTLQILKSATSVREASDYVLHNYEQPADQSEAVEIYRAGLGQEIFDKYSGTEPGPGPGPGPEPATKKKMPLWFYCMRRE